MATNKKEREQKFSLDDCLILCNLMAEGSGISGLTNHELLKHRFTEGITSQTKKKMWTRVSDLYNGKASKSRSADKLEKKWVNLVAKHRIIYTDHVRDRALTGGGCLQKTLDIVTEAVMNVIGIESPSIAGAAGVALDSSFSLLESFSAAAIPSHTVTQYLEVVAGPSESVDYGSRCNCSCHGNDQLHGMSLEQLKRKKIILEIQLLTQKLQSP
ncbi:uncharacterized protein LOC127843927 isoform X1 [Dreissena polymorpha]|uniref:Myb/SANT-like DNA-binding domain-containing protein n=2 Tax=Dreissena polymorpha TaxID=45954 RepID=A0A9D4DZ32_DREPO|nr:uncharacterized protein LOC127843927 isoform X1 [Dreissena polymorpha]KAH3769798.1 hypothetical protein DPMN_171074 [Dreissena polymorpha]